MYRSIFALVALALLSLAVTPAAHAERRVALVIGNGAYASVTKLDNPTRDASAVERMLRGAGFDAVEVKRDLGRDAMRRALRDFSDQARNAAIAVVYYAGHGIEVNGSNYLIPVDAVLERDIDIEDEAVPLDRVTQILAQAKRLRLVILDACRDNPFARSMRRTFAGRSIGRGLARVEVLTSDTLIAFAARAGSIALDGRSTNSPYTTALVKHLATPGLDVRLAFGRVRDEVLRSTNGRQEPFVYGSLGGAEIALVPARAGVVPAPPPPPTASDPAPSSSAVADAVRICRQVDGMSSPALLGVLARQHKGTPAADCIAARLAELKRIEAAQIAAATSGRSDILPERLGGPMLRGALHGIQFGPSPFGQAAVFRRERESRIVFDFDKGFPRQGTLEFVFRMDSAYKYSKGALHADQDCGLLFTTDIQGGDVTWPGSAWLYACRDGRIRFHIAGERYEAGWSSKYSLTAASSFRFGQWHRLSVTFGSEGRHIRLDGRTIASSGQTQRLGAGGNHSGPTDRPTIGESVSGFWPNNLHEGGFEGMLYQFRASPQQLDFLLSK